MSSYGWMLLAFSKQPREHLLRASKPPCRVTVSQLLQRIFAASYLSPVSPKNIGTLTPHDRLNPVWTLMADI
jgi:hypothetical protein